MLTAKDAVAISIKNDPAAADKYVEQILKEVEKAAKEGKRKIKTCTGGFGDSALYCNFDMWPKINQGIVIKLQGLGYVARQQAEERQFVDLWLEVSW